jgi:hypothetical protein
MIKSLVAFSLSAIFAVAASQLTSCTGYEPGAMQGGTEAGTAPGPGDTLHSPSSAAADGMGRPIAGGQQNIEPRQIYTRSDSAMTSRPY